MHVRYMDVEHRLVDPLVPHPGHQPPRPYDIRTIQELLGHEDVATTMIRTHVLNSVRSPLNH